MVGIAFPGHFLIGLGLGSDSPIIWDPFDGGAEVGPERLSAIYAGVTGQRLEPDSPQLRALVQPAHTRLILTRMLENLRRQFALTSSRARVADVLQLLAALHPDVPRIRDMLDEQPGQRDLIH